MLDKLLVDDFAPLVGEVFQLSLPNTGEQMRTLTLAEARTIGGTGPSGRQPFSLIFVDPLRLSVLPQQMYPIEHVAFGRLELFLVPIGPGSTGLQYQAIFA